MRTFLVVLVLLCHIFSFLQMFLQRTARCFFVFTKGGLIFTNISTFFTGSFSWAESGVDVKIHLDLWLSLQLRSILRAATEFFLVKASKLAAETGTEWSRVLLDDLIQNSNTWHTVLWLHAYYHRIFPCILCHLCTNPTWGNISQWKLYLHTEHL